MRIAVLQELSNDKARILACAMAAARAYPDSEILIACDKDTQSYIAGCTAGPNVRITYVEPSYPFTPRGYMCNFLELLEKSAQTASETLFLHCRIILLDKVPISENIREQGFAILRKDILGHDERPDIQYSCDIVYSTSIVKLSALDNYFRKNGLFENPEEDKFTDLVNLWRCMPLSLANMDDGNLAVTHYIDGSGYMTTENFFAFDKKWELKNLTQKDGQLCHAGHKIWCVRLEIQGSGPLLTLSRNLIAQVIACHRWVLSILELHMSGISEIMIATPPKTGILHWDRKDSPFYAMVSAICDSSQYIHSKTSNLDYFVLANNVLLDKPGVKWLTNSLRDATGIVYFDYDNQLLEALKQLGKPHTFGGYAVPYPDILDKASPYDQREEGNCFLATSETFSETEQHYAAHLAELSRHSYANIDASTPKHRIAECARLGVVPRIEPDVVIVELPELLANADNFSDKVEVCLRYYNESLSIKSITHKLLDITFKGH